MRWDWNWISPWSGAVNHAIKVHECLSDLMGKDNKKADELYIKVDKFITRYNNGERTLKLYSDLYSIKLRVIEKYVK